MKKRLICSGATIILTILGCFALYKTNIFSVIAHRNIAQTKSTTIPNEIFQAKAASSSLFDSTWVETSCRVLNYGNSKSIPLGPASWKVKTTTASKKITETYTVANWEDNYDGLNNKFIGIGTGIIQKSCSEIPYPETSSFKKAGDYAFTLTPEESNNLPYNYEGKTLTGIASGSIFNWAGCLKGGVKLSIQNVGTNNYSLLSALGDNSSLGKTTCYVYGQIFGFNQGTPTLSMGGDKGIALTKANPNPICTKIEIQKTQGNPTLLGTSPNGGGRRSSAYTAFRTDMNTRKKLDVFIENPTDTERLVEFNVNCIPEKNVFSGYSRPNNWSVTATEDII